MTTGRLERLATGLRGRTLKTAKLASRLGLGYAKRTLGGADGVVTDAMRERAVERAESLVEELGALKGLVMKVGQIASYMPGAMPPEAQRVLSRLQAKTTAMVWNEVAAVVREELGAPPEALFDEIDETPFAAASIGQVHRARIGRGQVAVKVQYPGIEDVLRSDLSTFGLIARLSAVGTSMDGGALVAELRARMLEECDYHVEADNQETFARLWADDPDARVPMVHRAYSSRRVLTTELIDAVDFQTFCDSGSQAERDRAGATIFRTCFDTVLHHCIYNADPHPGNYLFHEGGAVTFLDFGCVRRFDPALIDAWKAVARAVIDDDRAGFRRNYVDAGFVPKPSSFDWDHQWDMLRYLYEPFLSKEPFTYTHEYVQKSYGLIIFDNPNQTRTAMPPEWLFLNRLQWGLNSVLAFLGATAAWGDVWRAAIESETRPLTSVSS